MNQTFIIYLKNMIKIMTVTLILMIFYSFSYLMMMFNYELKFLKESHIIVIKWKQVLNLK
jgi:hypothetical protein